MSNWIRNIAIPHFFCMAVLLCKEDSVHKVASINSVSHQIIDSLVITKGYGTRETAKTKENTKLVSSTIHKGDSLFNLSVDQDSFPPVLSVI